MSLTGCNHLTTVVGLGTKSCELDIIPSNKLLKGVLDTILPAITHLLNESLTQGVFARAWNVAIIRPLLKKKSLDLVTNN